MNLISLGILAVNMMQTDIPVAPREMRGVWVCSVSNIDWPSKPSLSVEEQKEELLHTLDTAKRLRLNTIVFQVRPMADALYKSSLEPWSEYLTGEQGKAPEPEWDPLQFAVDEAHKRGLELHAWFNPYRAGKKENKEKSYETHFTKKHPGCIREYGVYQWMNPTDPIVKEQTQNVILDVVQRYDIDGIHIDDYFYPYPVRQGDSQEAVPFPDDADWSAYRLAGGVLSKNDWRRLHVNELVQNLHIKIKKEKPWIAFGISPFGIYRPNEPEGIKAGVNQYEDLSADVVAWVKNGWCDYIVPQIYWTDSNELNNRCFSRLIEWWAKLPKQNVKTFVGHYTDRIDPREQNWPVEEIPKQVEQTRKTEGISGQVHFRMRALLENTKGISDLLLKESYVHPALSPSYRELSWSKVVATKSFKLDKTPEGIHITWTPNPEIADQIRFWVIHAKVNNKWQMVDHVGSTFSEYMIRPEALDIKDVTALAINATDRYRRESEPEVQTCEN